MNQVNKKLLLTVCIFILLFAGGIALLSLLRKPQAGLIPTQQGLPSSPSQTAGPTVPPDLIPTSSAIVVLTSKGFEPQVITVKTKTWVNWKNESGGENAQITSQDYNRLRLGPFHTGENLSLVFDKPGTYTYYDYSHPNRTGTVVVK